MPALANEKPRMIHYTTTPRFLDLFNLKSLDDLPKTHDLQQL
jgi:chromosome segregation and condensation protein ScpB